MLKAIWSENFQSPYLEILHFFCDFFLTLCQIRLVRARGTDFLTCKEFANERLSSASLRYDVINYYTGANLITVWVLPTVCADIRILCLYKILAHDCVRRRILLPNIEILSHKTLDVYIG